MRSRAREDGWLNAREGESKEGKEGEGGESESKLGGKRQRGEKRELPSVFPAIFWTLLEPEVDAYMHSSLESSFSFHPRSHVVKLRGRISPSSAGESC